MGVKVRQKGTYGKIEKYLINVSGLDCLKKLDQYGEMGVAALSSATPVDTGKTASSWSYSIEHEDSVVKISWTNSNVVNHINIAIILQYGHGTRNGGYVQGRDYINPAMQPVFDKIAMEAWKEVTKT